MAPRSRQVQKLAEAAAEEEAELFPRTGSIKKAAVPVGLRLGVTDVTDVPLLLARPCHTTRPCCLFPPPRCRYALRMLPPRVPCGCLHRALHSGIHRYVTVMQRRVPSPRPALRH